MDVSRILQDLIVQVEPPGRDDERVDLIAAC